MASGEDRDDVFVPPSDMKAQPRLQQASRRRALVLLPAAVGVLVSVVLASPLGGRLPVAQRQFYVAADLAGLAWVLGLAISVLVAAGAWVWAQAHRVCDVRLEAAATVRADEHRRFIRRLDHELRNPLTAIQVSLANLVEMSPTGEAVPAGDIDSAAAAAALTSVQQQTARIGSLVTDLRKLAELEVRELSFDVVEISTVLTEVVAAAELQMPERPITLTLTQAPWPLSAVEGDWDLLFLAVYNLVLNALKFTGPEDAIELRAFEDGHDVVIEVADTGPGIPELEQSLVWEKLYRAEAARGTPGSGLGLALVRAIVARHGGQATLRSREGQGTVVTVRLPARPEA